MKTLSLFFSPVKGCHMVQMGMLPIRNGTIVGDRRFVLKDPSAKFPENQFVSMRHIPRMTRILQFPVNGGTRVQLTDRDGRARDLVIHAEDRGTKGEIIVWKKDGLPDRRKTISCSDDWSEWFSLILGQPVELFRQNPYEPTERSVGENIMRFDLQDAAPIHLVTRSSLESLPLGDEELIVRAKRFRANVIVDSNQEAFAEDKWVGKTFVIGSNHYLVCAPTGRCRVPFIHPITGENNLALAKYMGENRKTPDGIFFGLYLHPLFNEGVLRMQEDAYLQ